MGARDGVPDRRHPREPHGVTIERVRDAAGLGEFARINAENWSPPDPLVVRYYGRAPDSLLSDDSPLRFYLARRTGEAVAAVEVAAAGSALAVFNLSTRLDHRGHGIGGALLTRSLRDAAKETPSTASRRSGESGSSNPFVVSDNIHYVK